MPSPRLVGKADAFAGCDLCCASAAPVSSWFSCCLFTRFLHNNRITHLVPGTFNHLESMKRLYVGAECQSSPRVACGLCIPV